MRLVAELMGKNVGMFFSGVLLIFMLQGCTTPLINIEVGKCSDGTGSGLGVCPTKAVIPGTQYGSVTCQTGNACKWENSPAGCPRGSGLRCTTVDQGSGDCICQCL